MTDRVQAVDLQEAWRVLLDQTPLPSERTFLHLDDVGDAWETMMLLRVRGLPRVGGGVPIHQESKRSGPSI